MRSFESIAEFALHLAAIQATLHVSLERSLDRAAAIIEKDAGKRIGHYQGPVSYFPGWAPLAQSTESEKARLGYPTNAPLIRDGSLYGSISREVHRTEAFVGSTSDIAVFQELGTAYIPPRPFLGPAGAANAERVARIIGHAAAEHMLYGAGETLTPLGGDVS